MCIEEDSFAALARGNVSRLGMNDFLIRSSSTAALLTGVAMRVIGGPVLRYFFVVWDARRATQRRPGALSRHEHPASV